jgi:hypothetical protein
MIIWHLIFSKFFPVEYSMSFLRLSKQSRLQQQNFILSAFWKLELPNQGVQRSTMALGKEKEGS